MGDARETAERIAEQIIDDFLRARASDRSFKPLGDLRAAIESALHARKEACAVVAETHFSDRTAWGECRVAGGMIARAIRAMDTTEGGK